MHELSIALGILDIAQEEAARRGGVQIVAVHLKLGPLSGVVKEALLSAFELASEGSPLAGARLVVNDVPIRVHCAGCAQDCAIDSILDMRCPTCGTAASQVVGGRELEVTALELAE